MYDFDNAGIISRFWEDGVPHTITKVIMKCPQKNVNREESLQILPYFIEEK